MTGILVGKRAFVTGASRGIGAAIVRRLCREGAVVIFTYANATAQANALVEEISTAGGRVRALCADSGDADALQQAVASAVADHGGLDILVNNAGILLRGTVDEFSLDDFDRMVAVNVRAVFVAVQAASPHLADGGRIITTGSVTADRSGFPGAAVYSMTKGAIAAMTRGFARDFGARGITVNTVEPGPTETEMNADDAVRTMLKPMLALGRLGRDTEIANLVAWLAGPESSFVTDAALTIDGGYLA